MAWQTNDIALCLADSWCDCDGYPLIFFPPAGPALGQMISVAAIRHHPQFGSVDLRFKDWPEAWFDAASFQQIDPPIKRAVRRVSIRT